MLVVEELPPHGQRFDIEPFSVVVITFIEEHRAQIAESIGYPRVFFAEHLLFDFQRLAV